MDNTTIVYLAFGDRQEIFEQTFFSLLSLLRHQVSGFSILVVTDRPENFRYFNDRVETAKIKKSQVERWYGPHQYIYRCKLEALKLANEIAPEDHLLFFDSDTFIYSSPRSLLELLNLNQIIMHAHEGLLSESKQSTHRNMWRHLKNKEFEGFKVNQFSAMYNSGVIGLPKAVAKQVISHSLKVCDALCAEKARHAVLEQFALSIVVAKGHPVSLANNIVMHYWGNKPQWLELIREFMSRSLLRANNMEQDIAELYQLNLQTIPMRARRQRSNKRLKRLADRLFPKVRFTYFIHQ